MVGIRRSLYNLTAVCSFLAGSLLSLPGDGKNGSSASSSIISQFTLHHTEARSFQATATSRDDIITSIPQVSVSSIGQSDYLTTTTPGYLNTTARIQTQTANNASNSSTDPSLFLTPTTNLPETNTFDLDDDRRYISATSLLTSSTMIPATEILQSNETQGTSAASQPESSTFITMGPAKNTTPVMDHKAFTEENTVASTSSPRTTIGEQVITITTSNTSRSVTFEVASSTLLPHKILSAETEQPAKHDHKTTVFDVGNNQGLPSIPVVSPIGKDPLVIAVVVIFVVTVGILTLLGFLRYRQRGNRLRFRRLQDLPMDDMMEDTPLSLYSY
ncbi:uncharacterized protein [Pituophis catenifer annectens]|uniref:uncharacterized protein n=1 Tax=Pituophis catenifer annectens TaxID=94852 RepID=UPI0039963616